MTATLHALDLRAAFRREMARLLAGPLMGGPYSLVRDDALLVWMPDGDPVVVDDEKLAALRGLPAGAGVERVAEVLAS